IDMQGRSVVANVIREGDGGLGGVINLVRTRYLDHPGYHSGGGRVEASGPLGPAHWELGVVGGHLIDDTEGVGPGRRVSPDGGALSASNINARKFSIDKGGNGAIESPLFGGRLRISGRLYWKKSKQQ